MRYPLAIGGVVTLLLLPQVKESGAFTGYYVMQSSYSRQRPGAFARGEGEAVHGDLDLHSDPEPRQTLKTPRHSQKGNQWAEEEGPAEGPAQVLASDGHSLDVLLCLLLCDFGQAA